MHALSLAQPGTLLWQPIDEPGAPGPNEAQVLVHRTSICGTDFHAFDGNQPFFSYPRILGHELAVEIRALGSEVQNPALRIGSYCTVAPYLYCGACSACRRGKTNCCERLQVLGVHRDGGMRTLFNLSASALYPMENVSLDHIALVEPLAIGAHAVRRAELTPEDTVLIIGAGPIGLATALFAQLSGAQVCVMDLEAQRLSFATTHLGIPQSIDARSDALPQIKQSFADELPTAVFDATGSVRSMAQAPSYVANGGKLIFVGLVKGEISFTDAELHRRELTLLRSRNATHEDFLHVIATIEQANVNLDPWISLHAEPQNAPDIFATWRDPGKNIVKAMLTWTE